MKVTASRPRTQAVVAHVVAGLLGVCDLCDFSLRQIHGADSLWCNSSTNALGLNLQNQLTSRFLCVKLGNMDTAGRWISNLCEFCMIKFVLQHLNPVRCS